jgi:hypothetical protein
MAHGVHHHVALTVTGEGILVVASGEVNFQGAGFFAAMGPIR